MTISITSCRLCLVQCSDTDPPFWHYEYLLNQYEDFIDLQNVIPTKICGNCCGNLARLVAFRDRIRSEQDTKNGNLNSTSICRVCKLSCEKRNVKTSTVPMILRLCSALPLIPNQDFWGVICDDCIEDLIVLGYYLRKYKEVQKLLQEKEFNKSFDHTSIDSYQFSMKCQKILGEYRRKMGDERLMQELSYLTYFPKVQNPVENTIPIDPSSLFGINVPTNIQSSIKRDVKLEIQHQFEYEGNILDVNKSFPPKNLTQEIEEDVNSEPVKKLAVPNSKRPETAEYSCPTCGYFTHNKYKFKNHEKTHNKDLWLYCDLCPGRSFTNKAYLTNHMKRFHLPLKSIICSECGKKFKDHASRHYHHLSKHVDSVLWKYTCSVCGKKCYAKFHLNEHQNIHTAFRNYACHLCPYSSNRSTNLSRHMRTQHSIIVDVAK